MDNKHNIVVPDNVRIEIQETLLKVIGLISPYVVPLTPRERKEKPKMGEKTFSFVSKAYELALQNPHLRPSYLNMEDFKIDFSDAQGLWAIRNFAQQLYEHIDDIVLIAGSEAYLAALAFYNYIKLAAAQDVPGAKSIYNELKKRFPHGKQKPSEEDTNTDKQ